MHLAEKEGQARPSSLMALLLPYFWSPGFPALHSSHRAPLDRHTFAGAPPSQPSSVQREKASAEGPGFGSHRHGLFSKP